MGFRTVFTIAIWDRKDVHKLNPNGLERQVHVTVVLRWQFVSVVHGRLEFCALHGSCNPYRRPQWGTGHWYRKFEPLNFLLNFGQKMHEVVHRVRKSLSCEHLQEKIGNMLL